MFSVQGLAAKKGVGERSSIRNGSPPPLNVKTESRKNHNLTLVTGQGDEETFCSFLCFPSHSQVPCANGRFTKTGSG